MWRDCSELLKSIRFCKKLKKTKKTLHSRHARLFGVLSAFWNSLKYFRATLGRIEAQEVVGG